MIRPALLALLLGGCAPPSGECWLYATDARAYTQHAWVEVCALHRPIEDCERDASRLCQVRAGARR